MGIDTWGVDYVLLDKDDKILGRRRGIPRQPVRKAWMRKCMKSFLRTICMRGPVSRNRFFNTIYQLMAVKQSHPEYLEQAETILMVPDYFHYLLTGVKKNEYTEATTGTAHQPEDKRLGL